MKGFKWILLLTIVANAAIILRLITISQATDSSLVNMNAFQDGDIVLRDSKSLIGAQFKKMSQHDKKFSHAGIIRKENGTAFVYHMANENGQSGLLKSKLNDFVNTQVCSSYEIVRYPMKDNMRTQLLNQIDLLLTDKIHFDDEFVLNNQSYYCSELIADLINTYSSIRIPYSQIGDYKYYAIDNLYYQLPIQIIHNSNEVKIN
jgi:hypothetical protein